MRKFFIFISATLISACVAEFANNMAGLVDFPLYDANNQIGYIPKPNQAGSFMTTNDWAFNELSMGTARKFSPDDNKIDVLLIGDSIVYGGNPYKKDERLAPQLERVSGRTVWPISAGSWGLQNELQYLRDHPLVLDGVDQVVFVLNSGDFDLPSSWSSEMSHPRTHPPLALVYLLNKFVIKPKYTTLPEMKVPSRDIMADLEAFSQRWNKPFTVFLYADKQQSQDPALWEVAFSEPLKLLRGAAIPQMTIVDGRPLSKMIPDDYRDAVHPVPSANIKLATAIASTL
jgi:hypothetical protein